MINKYIKIKDKNISVIVRNYKGTNKVKMYFRGNILNISKPSFLSINEMLKIVKNNENEIYNDYMEIMSFESKKIKHWITGERIIYKGEEYIIKREKSKSDMISVIIEADKKQIRINIPAKAINEEDIKINVDKSVKLLFKNNTEAMLKVRLPYWSKKTGIEYNSFKVRDTITRLGSCVHEKKTLNFATRLIMLPIDKVDAIIVHELCHIVYPNHSKEFYSLVKKYIPNYDEIDKWLDKNTNLLVI